MAAQESRARSTYRIQLSADFGLEDASALVDYLAELGVTHLYSSPFLQAGEHGYAVTDPARVDSQLGGAASFDRLTRALQAHGLGHLLDIVPNHMAATADNPWWWDLLENGPDSHYASYFDLYSSPPANHHAERVLIPVLGDHYGRVLQAGELRLTRRDTAFRLCYYEHRFPLAPSSLASLIRRAGERAGHSGLARLADALAARAGPSAGDADPDSRNADQGRLRQQLAELCAGDAGAASAVDGEVERINADPEALDALIEAQHYRLAYWRTAEQELNYRRFFDVDQLVGLRQEAGAVFHDTHELVLDWLARARVDGLRLDHPDGLRDPPGYLRRLRSAAPECWLVVEKILEPHERLPPDWPVDGTTGYDFLNQVGGVMIDPAGAERLAAFYRCFTGQPGAYRPLLRQCKHQVLNDILGSEVNLLTERLYSVCGRHREHRDYTRDRLRSAITELIACFPVYRTYVRAAEPGASERDRQVIEQAVDTARSYRPELDPRLFDFLMDVLLLRYPGELETDLALRFQQLTAAAMAKGAEDTAFYNYNRLVALNEVGSAPDANGTTPEAFHDWLTEAARHRPRSLLATSTHDTKRSEDVRARLAVLTEIPSYWREVVERWSRHNARHRRGEWPERNTEYLLYQTLVGAWPLSRQRLLDYMTKAAREAKAYTRWRQQDAAYEQALGDFVDAILADKAFIRDLEDVVAQLVEPGRINALTQTVIKVTAPGIPDIYQGCELWDLSLVDPDNRRPVDFGLRRRLLRELPALPPATMLARSDEGLPKLWVLRQGLRLRARQPATFGPDGDYQPLRATGARRDHVIAFARGHASVITVAPRLSARLAGDWQDTELRLPDGRWRDELTGAVMHGGAIRLARLLADFPVALLVKEEATP